VKQGRLATAPAVRDPQSAHRAEMQELYRAMQRIRRFEEVIGDASTAGEFRGPTHLYIGQEAVAVGVCASLQRADLVFGGHRSHGHYLAKGGDISKLAAEILVRETGCSRGRGGSMHLTAPEVGVLGTSALVGGGMGTGVGTALASVRLGLDRVTVIFFGDGAIEEGVFHEALNCASLYQLPVIFVCENNLYASHMPLSMRQHRSQIYEHAIPYGMPGLRIDGNDVLEVRDAAAVAVARARAKEGPTLIECMTYRWRGHVGPSWDREFNIRPEAEIEEWVERCPIKRFRQRMVDEGAADGARIAELDAAVEIEVAESLDFARQSPFPKVEELLKFVYQE
jgi:TPP-dependent pyruvate/acetoin dehydrogenase alpha subunit